MMIRVGISGFANSGKDTFSDALVENYRFKKFAFADALKDILVDMDPVLFLEQERPVYLSEVVGSIGWDDAKDLYPKVRDYLVALGEAARKHLYPRIWLNKALSLAEPHDRVVFSDVRKMNEATVLKESYGAILINIIRPGTGPANPNEANTLPPQLFDFVIRNDGDLTDLRAKADLVMNRIGLHREHVYQGRDFSTMDGIREEL